MNPREVALTALEQAFNRWLMDEEIAGRLAALAGKLIAIEPQHLGMTLYIWPTLSGVRLTSSAARAPDVRLRAGVVTLARAGLAAQPGAGFFTGEIAIEGDADVAQRLLDILKLARWDWEEQLAQVAGDVVAHQVGRTVRDIFSWSQQTATTLTRDVAEYWHYEQRTLPPRHEIEAWLQAVDILRDDVERLAARLQRLVLRNSGETAS